MSKETGGQAFPCGSKVIGKDCMTGLPVFEMNSGMTLRDYFAAKAIPAVYADYVEAARLTGFDEDWMIGLAIDSYALADAMLEARK